MLEEGLISAKDTPEAKRAAERAAQPDEPEKDYPPPFEAPARGVIVTSNRTSPAARHCVSCGALLPSAQARDVRRCAECAGEAE
ncbi:MAG: hypothetical protein JWN44_3847 [Myxococcales bacterium]|nr:hypothetical protein [Myxococcales bacterium]